MKAYIPAAPDPFKFIIVLIAFLFLFLSRCKAQTVSPDFVDGVVYFKTYDTSSVHPDAATPPPAFLQLMATYQVSAIVKPFRTADTSLQHIYRASFANAAMVGSFISDLQNLSCVEYAEGAPLCSVSALPNDYSSTTQWSLAMIDAPNAWNVTTGTSAITVAIVDNGVNYPHQDLSANAWTNPGEIPNNGLDDDLDGYTDDVHGYDVSDNDGDPRPPSGNLNATAFVHGTHCAGIAAAVTNNSTGVASIGYHIRFISVKCTKDNTDGSTLSNTFEGVDYAISAGANVISMSFGTTTNSSTWSYLANVATLRGIVMVAAAGNNASSTPFYPAAQSQVIAVGATDGSDHIASFSNYGSWVDVMAPGTNIYSTLPDGGNTYGALSGTSMACPLVAGLAGLVLSQNPGMTPAQVATAIEYGCENIDSNNPSYAGQLGYGRINAFHSLTPTGMPQVVASVQTFGIYPNVSDGYFRVRAEDNAPGLILVEVYTLAGAKADGFTLPAMLRGDESELNLRGRLPDGGYIIRLTQADSQKVESFRVIISNQE